MRDAGTCQLDAPSSVAPAEQAKSSCWQALAIHLVGVQSCLSARSSCLQLREHVMQQSLRFIGAVLSSETVYTWPQDEWTQFPFGHNSFFSGGVLAPNMWCTPGQ